jgi:hypothetical protein
MATNPLTQHIVDNNLQRARISKAFGGAAESRTLLHIRVSTPIVSTTAPSATPVKIASHKMPCRMSQHSVPTIDRASRSGVIDVRLRLDVGRVTARDRHAVIEARRAGARRSGQRRSTSTARSRYFTTWIEARAGPPIAPDPPGNEQPHRRYSRQNFGIGISPSVVRAASYAAFACREGRIGCGSRHPARPKGGPLLVTILLIGAFFLVVTMVLKIIHGPYG